MPDVGFHCPQLGVELEYCYLHLVRWRESCVCTWKGPSIAGLVVEEMELDNFLYHSSIRRNLTQVSGIFCRKQVNIVRLGSWCLDVLNRIVLRYNTSSFVAPPSCPTIILMGGLEWNTPAGPGRHDYQRNRIHILTCTNASTLQVKYKSAL